MMADWFWDLATSMPALGLNGLVLLAALTVGFFPLLKYVPGVGPYVPTARLVAVLVASLMFFLVGFRVADEREEAKNLRATIAAQKADIDNAARSASEASQRASSIEKAADDRHDEDLQYIETLQNVPACLLDDSDINGMRRAAYSGRAKSPRRAGKAHVPG